MILKNLRQTRELQMEIVNMKIGIKNLIFEVFASNQLRFKDERESGRISSLKSQFMGRNSEFLLKMSRVC